MNSVEIEVKDLKPTSDTVKYLLKAYRTNQISSKTEEIKITNSDVIIQANPAADFRFSPTVKHVLTDFPAFFYLGIDNGANNDVHTINNQLYLYLKDNGADGCAGIRLFPINQDDLTKELSQCNINTETSIASDHPCVCELTKGTLNKTCIFQVEMLKQYATGKSCLIKVRTDAQFNASALTVKSVSGLPVINISAYNDGTSHSLFPDATKIDMLSNKLDSVNNWNLDDKKPENFDCASKHSLQKKCLLDDDILIEKPNETFFTVANNKFVINNYPGRNLSDDDKNRDVYLPKMFFIMAFKDNPWNQAPQIQLQSAVNKIVDKPNEIQFSLKSDK